jgi:hypothetical protein
MKFFFFLNQVFNLDKNEDDQLYFTFPLEGRSYERPLNSLIIKEIKVNKSKQTDFLFSTSF